MTTQPFCNHEKLCSSDLYGDCVPSTELATFIFSQKKQDRFMGNLVQKSS